jgi:hypothetical protein
MSNEEWKILDERLWLTANRLYNTQGEALA